MIKIDKVNEIVAAKQLQSIYQEQNTSTKSFMGIKYRSSKKLDFDTALEAVQDPRGVTADDVITALKYLCVASKWYVKTVCPVVEGM